MATQSIKGLDLNDLYQMIDAATRRVVFVAPGLKRDMAECLARAWRRLGKDGVSIILDVDPDVCRLGYGDIESVEILQKTAAEMGACLNEQPGLRIALVVADDGIVVYSPTPELIEAGDTKPESRVNSIKLGSIPQQITNDLGLGDEGVQARAIGKNEVEQKTIEDAQKDLAENPPRKFDLARIERVFNSHIEFVEFELTGISLNRHRVRIPSELVGLANSDSIKNLLETSFRLVDETSEINGQNIMDVKNEIVTKYLVSLNNYGKAILRKNRPDFEREVEGLKKLMEEHKKAVVENLQNEMDKNRKALVEALLPSVVRSPPVKWTSSIGMNPTIEDIRLMLDKTLAARFKTAEQLVKNFTLI